MAIYYGITITSIAITITIVIANYSWDFAPPPHAAPLSKAQFSPIIYSDIEILLKSILNKIY